MAIPIAQMRNPSAISPSGPPDQPSVEECSTDRQGSGADVVCFLVLCLASATAVAQPPKTVEEIKAIEERVAFWRTTCLGDWDAATHMTRARWRTTCERVAAERRQFLLQDPASFTIGKSRQR
jgi:hypothetical protein